MNESAKNTRTLIVSFVIAIMFLIPLRFIEVGQNMSYYEPQVLGEQVEVVETMLPNDFVETAPMLEAPYNEIDGVASIDCLSSADAKEIVDYGKAKIENGGLTGIQVDMILEDIAEIENKICK